MPLGTGEPDSGLSCSEPKHVEIIPSGVYSVKEPIPLGTDEPDSGLYRSEPKYLSSTTSTTISTE